MTKRAGYQEGVLHLHTLAGEYKCLARGARYQVKIVSS